MGKFKEQAIDKMNEEPKNKKEVTTQVTTIAEEEERTGEKIDTGETPEELVAKCQSSIIMNRKHLALVLEKLGKGALKRVIMATMDMPTDDVPVKFVKNEEKVAFRLCQNIIRAMFTTMFYHTSEQIMERHKTKMKEEKCQTDKITTDTPQEPTQSSQSGGFEKEKKESTSPQSPTENDKQ